MNLDQPESGMNCSSRSLDKAIYHCAYSFCVQLVRQRIAGGKSQAAGSDRPPGSFCLSERLAAIPRPTCAGFAPGVSQLNAGEHTLLGDEARAASQRLHM